MKTSYSRLLLATLVGFLHFAAPANAATKHVNCDTGQTISKAIEKAAGSADLLEITVSGECNENITIRHDRVWITGDPFAQINGTVRVFSSNNVKFFDLAITGTGDGLNVSGSEVFTDGVHLVNNNGIGLVARRHSHVWFRNSEIIGNCEDIPDDDCDHDGASVENASLDLENSSIFHSRNGIFADVGAHVILHTFENGITEVAYNSVVGVSVHLHSVVDLRGNTRIHDNRFHGLFAAWDSAIRILHSQVEVVGNIGCLDEESSFDNWGGGSITSFDCSGF